MSNRKPFKLQLDPDYVLKREKELLIEDVLKIIPTLSQKDRLNLQNQINQACQKAYFDNQN